MSENHLEISTSTFVTTNLLITVGLYSPPPPPPRIFTSSYFDKTQEQSFIQCNVNFSLSIFYLLKSAKGIRHKLNKFMKSFPIYNKLQHTYEVFSYIQ